MSDGREIDFTSRLLQVAREYEEAIKQSSGSAQDQWDRLEALIDQLTPHKYVREDGVRVWTWRKQ